MVRRRPKAAALENRLRETGDGKLWAIKLVTLDKPGGKALANEMDFKALTKIQTIRHPRLLTLERLTLLDNLLLLIMEPAEKN